MAKVWEDAKGQKWEIKIERGRQWHRRLDKGDDKWIEGPPPSWIAKPKIPLDQR